MRLGKKVFGENKASKGMLPLRAGEDFGYLNENKPGAYFFLTTAEG